MFKIIPVLLLSGLLGVLGGCASQPPPPDLQAQLAKAEAGRKAALAAAEAARQEAARAREEANRAKKAYRRELSK